MNPKKVQVFRTFENESQTLGVITVTDPKEGVVFVARTLELPDKNNANSVSRILAGKYLCKYTRSNSFSQSAGKDVYTYEITSVPNRSGVRIHSANFFSQLRGCISMGDAHRDINADTNPDVTNSGRAIFEFEKVLNKEDFELEILDVA
jgi:hypothetical protein